MARVGYGWVWLGWGMVTHGRGKEDGLRER